jgi:ribosomal protein S6
MSKETLNENKKAYELAFHIVPSLGVEEVNGVFENVKKILEDNKAKVLSGSEPTLLNLEYQMEKIVDAIKYKFNNAYFAWIIFEDGNVIEIADLMKQNKSIIRYLLIKTEQTDSISTADVANLLEKEDEYRNDVYQTEEQSPIEKEEEIVEEEDATVSDEEEIIPEEVSDQNEVDEAIDKLIKE